MIFFVLILHIEYSVHYKAFTIPILLEYGFPTFAKYLLP